MNDTLNFYAQYAPHDEVYIAGTRQALQDLRDAIDRALGGDPQPMAAFAGDGEGYPVHVVVADAAQMDQLIHPYAAVSFGRYPVDAKGPWDLVADAHRSAP